MVECVWGRRVRMMAEVKMRKKEKKGKRNKKRG